MYIYDHDCDKQFKKSTCTAFKHSISFKFLTYYFYWIVWLCWTKAFTKKFVLQNLHKYKDIPVLVFKWYLLFQKDEIDLMRIFVVFGADVNQQNNTKHSPRHMAAVSKGKNRWAEKHKTLFFYISVFKQFMNNRIVTVFGDVFNISFSWNDFNDSSKSLNSSESNRAVVSDWREYVHSVLVTLRLTMTL